MTTSLQENIAAIAFGIALERGTDGSTFSDRFGEALQGHIGCLQWLIAAAEEFTRAELIDQREFDWYLAIDEFVRRIMSADGLPSSNELYEMARGSIVSNREDGAR